MLGTKFSLSLLKTALGVPKTKYCRVYLSFICLFLEFSLLGVDMLSEIIKIIILIL